MSIPFELNCGVSTPAIVDIDGVGVFIMVDCDTGIVPPCCCCGCCIVCVDTGDGYTICPIVDDGIGVVPGDGYTIANPVVSCCCVVVEAVQCSIDVPQKPYSEQQSVEIGHSPSPTLPPPHVPPVCSTSPFIAAAPASATEGRVAQCSGSVPQ